jgi:hypothetical protein
MAIQFTQYLLPNGRRRQIEIERPDDIEAMAQILVDHGCFFDAEVLRTDHVSLTCEHDDDLIAIQVCPNDENVPRAVDNLVRDAYEKVVQNGSG